VIGSAQSKNDHLKLEIDVDAELTESFASWLVTCPTKNYARRQGMYIPRNLEGGAGEAAFFTPFATLM
jgi:hypothetical protein